MSSPRSRSPRKKSRATGGLREKRLRDYSGPVSASIGDDDGIPTLYIDMWPDSSWLDSIPGHVVVRFWGSGGERLGRAVGWIWRQAFSIDADKASPKAASGSPPQGSGGESQRTSEDGRRWMPSKDWKPDRW